MLVLIQGRRHKQQNTIFFSHEALRDLVLNCFVRSGWAEVRRSWVNNSLLCSFSDRVPNEKGCLRPRFRNMTCPL